MREKTVAKILSFFGLKRSAATLTKGTAIYNSIVRFGNIGFLFLGLNNLSGMTTGTWNQIGTVPEEYKPYQNSETCCFVGSGYGFAVVRTDGTIHLQPTISGNVLIRVIIPLVFSGGGYCIVSLLCAISSFVRRWSYENSMELTGEVADHISCCKRRIKIHQDKEDWHLLGESTNKQQRLMRRKSSVDVSKYHGDVYNRHCIIWRESSICRSNGINTSRKHTGLYQSLYKVRYVSSCKLLRWLACNRFAVALEGGCC